MARGVNDVPQTPRRIGSQTERSHGVYQGRSARMISNGQKRSFDYPKMESRLTKPILQSFFSSLGYGPQEEQTLLKQEMEEFSHLRKEYDRLKEFAVKQEQQIKDLESDLINCKLIQSTESESKSKTGKSTVKIEQQVEATEMKLEQELADRNVYKHMLERLTNELHIAQKLVGEKEKELEYIQQDLHSQTSLGLAAQQERVMVEQTYQLALQTLVTTKEENRKAVGGLEQLLSQKKKRKDIFQRKSLAKSAGNQRSKKKESVQQILSDVHSLDLESATEDSQSPLQRLKDIVGTDSIDEIISKYLTREDINSSLKKEIHQSEARLQHLRQRETELQKQLENLEGKANDVRKVYKEMDEISNEQKKIGRNTREIAERSKKVDLIVEAIKESMKKNLEKVAEGQQHLSYDQLPHDLVLPQDLNALAIADLLQLTEKHITFLLDQKKADSELLRTDKHKKEMQDHSISKVTKSENLSKNVRVEAKILLREQKTHGNEAVETNAEEKITDEIVMDRETNKKIAHMVLTRQKRKGNLPKEYLNKDERVREKEIS